jgi:ribosomal protein S18 acetylase RimI-like enzyme
MIDQRFQGNGWGKKSFAKVLEHIQETFHPHTIELSTNNPIAIGLYSSFGFVSEDTDRSREYFQKYRETLFILRVCR